MTKRRQTALAKARATLGALSLADLKKLRADLDDLIAVLEAGEAAGPKQHESTTQAPSGRVTKGYIEEKTIRGCGPYLYLRVWQGKTLTSKYLGKKAND